MSEYPKREKFFSHRFTRLMAKCCVANDIGPLATWLLTVIVQTEDASHYRRGVTFTDGQLGPIVGSTNWRALSRARQKAIAAGWLHYEQGHKGKPSTYWVCIPSVSENIDDNPTDESFDEIHSPTKTPMNNSDSPAEMQVIAQANGQSNIAETDDSPANLQGIAQANGQDIQPYPCNNNIPNPNSIKISDKQISNSRAAALAHDFCFYWSMRKGSCKTPLSAIDIEPQFTEHLRLHPEDYEHLKDVEIPRHERNKNEWPDVMLRRAEKRHEGNANGSRKGPGTSKENSRGKPASPTGGGGWETYNIPVYRSGEQDNSEGGDSKPGCLPTSVAS